jgi:hypothetical protein
MVDESLGSRRNNPPKCIQRSKKLKKEGVDARIAHYVKYYIKSKAPRHERLRALLPLLQAASCNDSV